MISIQTLTTFFGWCTVINLVFIVVVFLFFGAFMSSSAALWRNYSA